MGDPNEDAAEPQEPASAQELADGLRFVHTLGMQTRRAVTETAARLEGLVAALGEAGVLEGEPEPQARSAAEPRVRVQVSRQYGKYFLERDQLPDIDCASLLPLCRARCCRMSFPLGFEDLDEGVLRWDYGRPYLIRQRPDGACVHNDAESLRCTVYAQRPCRCRTYDCRDDPRIWVDFDNKIPNRDPLP